ncbi:MAG: hypothetical protein GX902_12515, partial [Lentisphaerae bacterium]|nr:hypothetical protein [Lentisphaerota bacterium]
MIFTAPASSTWSVCRLGRKAQDGANNAKGVAIFKAQGLDAHHSRSQQRFNEEELTAKDANNAKGVAIFKAQGLDAHHSRTQQRF